MPEAKTGLATLDLAKRHFPESDIFVIGSMYKHCMSVLGNFFWKKCPVELFEFTPLSVKNLLHRKKEVTVSIRAFRNVWV